MKRMFKGIIGLVAITFLATSAASALTLGDNITIYNGVYPLADQDIRVMPNSTFGQEWELEGMFLDSSTLTMVGGYNFRDGQIDEYSRTWRPGDIFLDVDGNAQYGNALVDSGNGNMPIYNTIRHRYA